MAAALALLSSLFWGAADFGGGLAAKQRHAAAVAGWSQGTALIALCVVLPFTGGLTGPTGWIGWSLGAGTLGAVGLVAFYTALATGTMGVVSPIAALGSVVPVLVGLLSGESPSSWQLLGIVLGIAGVVAASGPELDRVRVPEPGAAAGRAAAQPAGPSAGRRSVLLAVLAGACFGATLVGVQRGAAVNPLLTMVGMRVASVSMFTVVAVSRHTLGGVRSRNLPGLAAVGLLDLSGNLMFALASRRGLVSVVGVLGALYPVATVLLGRVVLGERLQLVQRIGVAITLSGVVLLAAG